MLKNGGIDVIGADVAILVGIAVVLIINNGNFSVLDEFVHPDYVFRSPSEELHGPEGFKGLIAAYRTTFPYLDFGAGECGSENTQTDPYYGQDQ